MKSNALIVIGVVSSLVSARYGHHHRNRYYYDDDDEQQPSEQYETNYYDYDELPTLDEYRHHKSHHQRPQYYRNNHHNSHDDYKRHKKHHGVLVKQTGYHHNQQQQEYPGDEYEHGELYKPHHNGNVPGTSDNEDKCGQTSFDDPVQEQCYKICCAPGQTEQLKQDCFVQCEALKTQSSAHSTSSSDATSTSGDEYADNGECISIQSTTACAPWTSGYYINKTELSLVYGSQINTQADWDDFVYSATDGGEQQAKQWGEWARCDNYGGEPIQYSRSYTCLTDIFLFSAGCNKKAPEPKPCPDTCDVYGRAVEALLDSDACPADGDYRDDPELYREIESRRTILRSAAKGCHDILSSWSTGAYTGQVSKQGFSNGGYAEDYKEGVSDSCPRDSYIIGVSADDKYCGFSGNLEVAQQYCNDYENAPCCQNLAKESYTRPEGQASDGAQSNVQSLTAQGADATSGGSGGNGGNNLFVGIGVTAGIVALASMGGAFAFTRRKKRGQHSRVAANDPNSGPLMSSVTTKAAPAMTATSNKVTKYQVIHAYEKSLPDELELRVGDTVAVSSIFDDGWARGRNVSTQQEGTFPLACVKEGA